MTMAKKTRKVSELKIIRRAFCACQPHRSCVAPPGCIARPPRSAAFEGGSHGPEANATYPSGLLVILRGLLRVMRDGGRHRDRTTIAAWNRCRAETLGTASAEVRYSHKSGYGASIMEERIVAVGLLT